MYKLTTILAATDFSESAENAVDYAAALAQNCGAGLVILNAYHVPLVASEVPTLMFTLNELEKGGMEELKTTEARVKKNNPGLKSVDLLCLHGFAGEIIKTQVEKLKAGLVVMGLQGGGFFNEKVIGSNAYEMVNDCNAPVLIVHRQLNYSPLKRILLASDHKTIPTLTSLDPLKTLAKQFDAEVCILHVNKNENQVPGMEAAVGGVSLDHYLEEVKHGFYEITAPNVTEGLNAFAKQHNIDLTVALARHHGFFESLFRKNQMQDMIYHLDTPILTIHQ